MEDRGEGDNSFWLQIELRIKMGEEEEREEEEGREESLCLYLEKGGSDNDSD